MISDYHSDSTDCQRTWLSRLSLWDAFYKTCMCPPNVSCYQLYLKVIIHPLKHVLLSIFACFFNFLQDWDFGSYPTTFFEIGSLREMQLEFFLFDNISTSNNNCEGPKEKGSRWIRTEMEGPKCRDLNLLFSIILEAFINC